MEPPHPAVEVIRTVSGFMDVDKGGRISTGQDDVVIEVVTPKASWEHQNMADVAPHVDRHLSKPIHHGLGTLSHERTC